MTLVMAGGGLLLGVRAELRARGHDRVRIRVIPKISYPVGPVLDRAPRFAIEVVNNSKFAVTVDEVGFQIHNERSRFAVTVPVIVDGKPWPRRLDPNDAVITYVNIDLRLTSLLGRLKCAYATTATGETYLGTSGALRTVASTASIPPFPSTLAMTGLPGFINVANVDR